jgi:serine/threonine protein kinase/Tfp pilus assembly protein PilF
MALMVKESISHYRILKKLGAGGMGEVYLAEDTRLDRKVALKLLLPEFVTDEDRLQRFVQEAKSAAALSHPNIAHIYEVGEADGAHYIAMEFIDGDTLTTRTHRDKYPLGTLLKYLSQVAEGLAKAHAAAIVHRDLKPDNIMITRDGYAKILDFGLAKLVENRIPSITSEDAATAMMPARPLSAAGAVMGTVGYMSPEQAQGKSVDQRSDIFSFGCILFEAVTGRRPFGGDSAIDMLHKIIYSPPAQVKDFYPGAPADLQRVIRRCLEKDPEKRYQTIRDVGNELEDVRQEIEVDQQAGRSFPPRDASAAGVQTASGQRATETSDSRPSSTSSAEYLVSRIRRHRLGAALVLALLLALVAAVGYFALFARGEAGPIESIAVMPFVNESGNSDVDYLSDGMTETLIKSLSQLPNLSVKARSSVFRYKGKDTSPQTIGKELNVQAILNGLVAQRGDQLMLSLELIDAQTENVIWAENYNRKRTDLVTLQSELARDVSRKLKTKLSGADVAKVTKSYTANSEAYQLYLRGRFHWNKRTYEDLLKAIELFKAAIDKDADYALAYAGLADTYSIIPYYHGSKSGDYMQQAKFYAQRGVQIDDQLAETHTSLAFVNEGAWNWSEAEKHYNRAIELNPNYATAHTRYARFEIRVPDHKAEALMRMKAALELEPSSLVTSDNLSQLYLVLGDVDASVEQARRTIELDSQFSFGWIDLTYALLKKGQYADALASAAKTVEVANRSSRSLVCLGVARAVGSQRSAAMAMLKELEERYRNDQADATEVAAVYAGLGDKDQAFVWLDRAFANHSSLLVDLRAEFPFSSIRDDPRYKDLLKRMNLPE